MTLQVFIGEVLRFSLTSRFEPTTPYFQPDLCPAEVDVFLALSKALVMLLGSTSKNAKCLLH